MQFVWWWWWVFFVFFSSLWIPSLHLPLSLEEIFCSDFSKHFLTCQNKSRWAWWVFYLCACRQRVRLFLWAALLSLSAEAELGDPGSFTDYISPQMFISILQCRIAWSQSSRNDSCNNCCSRAFDNGPVLLLARGGDGCCRWGPSHSFSFARVKLLCSGGYICPSAFPVNSAPSPFSPCMHICCSSGLEEPNWKWKNFSNRGASPSLPPWRECPLWACSSESEWQMSYC